MNGICHVEIPCTDFEKVKKFYDDVFGWKTDVMPQMDYAVFKTPDGVGGGFSTKAKISKEAGILLYIETDDIDSTLKKIEGSGGKSIQQKTQISPEYGYYAVFSDNEGNVMGLWSKN